MDESTNEKFEILLFLKKTFINIPFFIGVILAFWLGKNWTHLSEDVSGWSVTEYILLKDFIGAIFSWPIITLLLVLTFFRKFPVGINRFLENSRGKTPFTESVNDDSQAKQNYEMKSIVTEKTIQESGDQNKFEFAYLNLYLVWNTKIALATLSSTPSTQGQFISYYPLPKEVINPEAEKNAILQSLVESLLINIDPTSRLITVTEKGERFLKSIGLLKK